MSFKTLTLEIELVRQAASQFIGSNSPAMIESLGQGLIHQTYKVTEGAHAIVLQAINRAVFKNPEDIVSNYFLVYEFLREQRPGVSMASPVRTKSGKTHFIDPEKNFWRATAFIQDSYSPSIANDPAAAGKVAGIFAAFTRALSGIHMGDLKEIIPGFHHLDFRYIQLELAIQKASINRLLKSTHQIASFRERKWLVDFYISIKSSPSYPDRVMHHDCKISNILFEVGSKEVICPVDLDTLMPGKYFSDLGDMIRSMACSEEENSTAWERIKIMPAFYTAILESYLEKTNDILTIEEKKHIHYAGLIMIYMQGIRFLADYLDGDRYYKTSYDDQNLNRALNQLILLERLEEFLKDKYGPSFS